MKYTYKIAFEAESDEEAQEQVWGRDESDESGYLEGANSHFDSIHSETLTREDGTTV